MRPLTGRRPSPILLIVAFIFDAGGVLPCGGRTGCSSRSSNREPVSERADHLFDVHAASITRPPRPRLHRLLR